MANERIDIEVTDRIATTVVSKLKDIATQSKDAHAAITKLNKELSRLQSTPLGKLTTAAQANTKALLGNQTAQQKLAQATANTAKAQAQAHVATSKLAQAQAQAAQAASRLSQQTAATAQAHTNAAAAALRYQTALQKVNQTAAQSKRGGGVEGLAALAGGALLGRNLIEQIDRYQTLSNRIRAVTDSEEERIGVQRRLLEIGRENYTSIESLTSVYQRFTPRLEQLNIRGEKAYTIISNLSKAVAISGATTQEADGALRQLSQAFGANRLSGQELNSVLEQLPPIADLIAKQLGVTRSELKKLSLDGSIDSKVIADALGATGKGVDELRKRFDNLKPSISQAMVGFNDELTTAIGKLGEATGVNDAFSQSILFLADNIYLVTIAAGIVFPILIGGFIKSNAAAAIFNATILKNPLFILVSIITGVLVAFGQFQASLDTITEKWKTFGAVTQTVFQVIARGLSVALEAVDTLINLTHAMTSSTEEVLANWSDLSGGVDDFLKRTDKIPDHLQKFSDQTDKVREHFQGVVDAAEKAKTPVDKLGTGVSDVEAAATATSERFADIVGSAAQLEASQYEAWVKIRGSIDDATSALDKYLDKSRQAGGSVPAGGAPMARGGPVRGPGTSRSDSIPAMLSNGEFVVNASAAQKYGGMLHRMNALHMADGGQAWHLQSGGGRTYKVAGPKPASQGGADYEAGGIWKRDEGGPYSFTLGGGDMAAINASGFRVYIGRNGRPGGYEYTGNISSEITAQIAEWNNGLSAWWGETRKTVTPGEASAVDKFISKWKKGNTIYPLPFVRANERAGNMGSRGVSPNTYKYDDALRTLGTVGWAASILSGAPPWGSTVGQFVSYDGPSYGSTVNYGSFKDGGSFMVGGRGGPDSQMVQFMASPDERITVETPQQQQMPGGGGGPLIGELHVHAETNGKGGFNYSAAQLKAQLYRDIQDVARQQGIR